MKKTIYFTHSVALYALYILGSAVIQMPSAKADEFTFMGYLVTIITGFLLYLAVIPIANRIFSENKSFLPSKSLSCLIFLAISVAASFLAADTFIDFTNFAHSEILYNQSSFFTVVIFASTVLFFSLRQQEHILKFALISFCFTAVAVIVFILLTLHNYNLRNIFIFRLPTVPQLIKQSKPYLLNPVIPSLLLPIYNNLVFKKCKKKVAFIGLGLGFVTLGACILSSVLLFGPHFAGTLDFPYAASISTVTVGRLFTRMDGFSYFIYFASALIQITVCIFIVKSCIKKINKILK